MERMELGLAAQRCEACGSKSITAVIAATGPITAYSIAKSCVPTVTLRSIAGDVICIRPRCVVPKQFGKLGCTGLACDTRSSPEAR